MNPRFGRAGLTLRRGTMQNERLIAMNAAHNLSGVIQSVILSVTTSSIAMPVTERKPSDAVS
jgi:hypothetical protein